MKAEIIAVGSELLTPARMDTNSLYLTAKLNEAGFEVHLKTIVGDNAGDIENILRAAMKRSRLVILCGGLGPTEDDLTRTAAARALGRSIRVDEGILDGLRRRFAQRGYRMAPINERQAEVIDGADVLENPVGTAPGLWIDAEASVVLLPGPPRELKATFEAHVLPRARKIGAGRRLEKRALILQGLPESEVDTRIAPIYQSYPRIQTTILAAKGAISIWLQQWLAPGDGAADLDELCSRIQAEFGDLIFSSEDEPLEMVVGNLLRSLGRTLAVAESCTAGLVGAAITRIPGSSDYFLGGVQCYSNEMKTNLCRVPRAVLDQYGAVSAEAAEALARGIREVNRRFRSAGDHRDCWPRRRIRAKTRRVGLFRLGRRGPLQSCAPDLCRGSRNCPGSGHHVCARDLAAVSAARRGQNMRTFIAVPLPPEARTLLADVQAEMRSFRADVKWTAPDSIHLTLKFLGEIDPAILPALAGLLREQTAVEAPFTMRMYGLGGFPNARNPRVIWFGLEGDLRALSSLQAKVESACAKAGFPPEQRPFRPHFTLGRVRSKSNLQPLTDYIKIGSALEHTFTVKNLNIYQSTLRRQGAVYAVLEEIELKGATVL